MADGASSADQTMNDIIDLLNGRSPNARRAPRKGPDIVHQLAVSLEDLYNGKTFRLAVNRDVPCESCNATGCRNGNVVEVMCGTCGGAGARVQLRQLVWAWCSRCRFAAMRAPARARWCRTSTGVRPAAAPALQKSQSPGGACRRARPWDIRYPSTARPTTCPVLRPATSYSSSLRSPTPCFLGRTLIW